MITIRVNQRSSAAIHTLRGKDREIHPSFRFFGVSGERQQELDQPQPHKRFSQPAFPSVRRPPSLYLMGCLSDPNFAVHKTKK